MTSTRYPFRLLVTLLAVATSAVAALAAEAPPAAAPAAEAPDGKVRLRLALTKGDSYRIKFTAEQEITQTPQGKTVEVKQTLGIEYDFQIEDTQADGTMAAKVSYRAVQMKMDGPMGKVDYDSASPPGEIPAMAKGFSALVGQSFTIEITPAGKVTKVDGVDELLDGMVAKLDLPAATRPLVEKQLKNQFGDEAIRGALEQLMAIYPAQPVAPGDSWTRKAHVRTGFPIEMETSYTLKERKDGVAILQVDSKLKSIPTDDPDTDAKPESDFDAEPRAKPMKIGPLTIRYELSGTQQGQTELDEATGWTLRGNLTQKFSGTMTMEGAPGTTEPVSWPIEVTSKVTIEAPKSE